MRAVFLSTVFRCEPWAQALAPHCSELELSDFPVVGDPAAIEAALVWYPPPGALGMFPRLELVHALGAGVDHILADPALPRHVPVVRLIDPYMTAAMVDYVSLQVLRLHHDDFAYRVQQAASVWQERVQPSAAARRVGILGLGTLGAATAARLQSLGFDVAGWSRRERRLPDVQCFAGRESLGRLVARTDILVCLLPLTEATADILDARLFAALPKGAALINCGRGGHLVETDLLAALASGQISAAVLDVFRSEPLPPSHPFWHHPRILVTPHVAAQTHPPTAAPIVAEALKRMARGERPANEASRKHGY